MSRFRYVFITYVALVLWLSSCGTRDNGLAVEQSEEPKRLEQVQEEHQRRSTTAGLDTISFETAFARFLQALHTSDTVAVNQFIHLDYGLWVIEQPGALPRMTNITDIRHFQREFENRSFFTVGDEVKTCDLKEEPWPSFDCADMDYDKDQSGYSKEGCFVSAPDKFQKSAYWDYTSLSEADIKRILAALPLLQKSVLHTASSFEFHFGQVDGQWQVLFVKLIYPCSA
jgi:hypothetical protein